MKKLLKSLSNKLFDTETNRKINEVLPVIEAWVINCNKKIASKTDVLYEVMKCGFDFNEMEYKKLMMALSSDLQRFNYQIITSGNDIFIMKPTRRISEMAVVA